VRLPQLACAALPPPSDSFCTPPPLRESLAQSTRRQKCAKGRGQLRSSRLRAVASAVDGVVRDALHLRWRVGELRAVGQRPATAAFFKPRPSGLLSAAELGRLAPLAAALLTGLRSPHACDVWKDFLRLNFKRRSEFEDQWPAFVTALPAFGWTGAFHPRVGGGCVRFASLRSDFLQPTCSLSPPPLIAQIRFAAADKADHRKLIAAIASANQPLAALRVLRAWLGVVCALFGAQAQQIRRGWGFAPRSSSAAPPSGENPREVAGALSQRAQLHSAWPFVGRDAVSASLARATPDDVCAPLTAPAVGAARGRWWRRHVAADVRNCAPQTLQKAPSPQPQERSYAATAATAAAAVAKASPAGGGGVRASSVAPSGPGHRVDVRGGATFSKTFASLTTPPPPLGGNCALEAAGVVKRFSS
jgi:hypothetical protein